MTSLHNLKPFLVKERLTGHRTLLRPLQVSYNAVKKLESSVLPPCWRSHSSPLRWCTAWEVSAPHVELYQNALALKNRREYAQFVFCCFLFFFFLFRIALNEKWAGKDVREIINWSHKSVFFLFSFLGSNKLSLKPSKRLGYNLFPPSSETSFKWNVAVSSGASRGDALPSSALWYLRWKTGGTNEPYSYLFSTWSPSAALPPAAVLLLL